MGLTVVARFQLLLVAQLKMTSGYKVLDRCSISPGVHAMNLVRGVQYQRAAEILQEMRDGVQYPFESLFMADIGDAQAMGQKPISFIRQVTSLCLNGTTEENTVPEDVQTRVKEILQGIPAKNIGVYSGEWGIPKIRQHVAEYIEKRDGGIPSNPDHILLSTGASGAIFNVMSLFSNNSDGVPTSVMVPVPQYPLYGSLIAQLGFQKVNYYLNEDNNWNLDIAELENAINSAKKNTTPKILVVINPGNPTGQVLSRKCIEDVVRFAYREKLYIFADEVYQQNVFQNDFPFHSFKKVMVEMGHPYSSMELASFMSVSKGYAGECGLRGGYVELFNPCPSVIAQMIKVLQTQLCPSVVGQLALSCVAKEPKPGDASFELFQKEKAEVLESQKRRSVLVSAAFNGFKRITCNPVMGAMYAFPRLHLPERAIEEARKRGLEPDQFYILELLNQTGICVGPGMNFGQTPGTFHLRMTILTEEKMLNEKFDIFRDFNDKFMGKYE